MRARPASSASGAPVWKPSQLATAAVARSAGSSQTGVSWSQSVSATAAAVGDSGAGGATRRRAGMDRARPRHARPSRRGTPPARRRPGRRSRRRCVLCGRPSVLSAHHGEEIDLGRGRLGAPLRVGLGGASRAAARRPRPRPRRGVGVLPQRIEDRGEPRLLRVAAERIGVADLRRSAAGPSARVTVASPRLNGAPPPPMRPRTMTSPVSGPRSDLGLAAASPAASAEPLQFVAAWPRRTPPSRPCAPRRLLLRCPARSHRNASPI